MSSVTKISWVLVGVDFDEASASALKMAGLSRCRCNLARVRTRRST